MSEARVHAGSIVADKYRVEHLLGEGGMGAVYQARHIELDQLVAIKVLLNTATSDMARRRFRREARAAARMRGEHVCRVLDVGELPDSSPYMVMEYLEGRDLGDELAERGRLPPEEAVGYTLQACEALAEAHAAGVVHRDLKPGNLFLYERVQGRRVVKVLDFGVSKVLDGASTPGGEMSLTSTSMLVGSPLYMSPEQLESSRDVDGRTDIWSLGVVLHEMLSGDPPFLADTMPQLVRAVLSGDPPALADLGVDAPAGLAEVVGRALAKDRDARFGTVAELADALLPFADSVDRSSAGRVQRYLSGPPRDVAPDDDEAISRADARPTPTPNGWERSADDARAEPTERRGPWLWVAAAVLLLAGGAAAWMLRPDETAAGGTTTTAAAAAGSVPGQPTEPVEGERLGKVPPPTPVGSVVQGGSIPTDEPVEPPGELAEPPGELAEPPGELAEPPGELEDPAGEPVADPSTSAPPVKVDKPRRPKPAVRRRPKPAPRPAPPAKAPVAPVAAPGAPDPSHEGLPDFGGRR